MKKLLKPSFLPKLLIILFMAAELGLLIYGLVMLANLSIDHNMLSMLVVLLFIGNLISSILIINSSSPDIYRLTWLFVVNCLPLVGLFMYIAFANKQTSSRQKKKYVRLSKHLQNDATDPKVYVQFKRDYLPAIGISEYLQYATGSGAYDHTSVEYFALGDDAFPKMIEELKKAKHYIFMEYFIYETPGIFFDTIHEVLKQKAAEGVDVRLIYDDMGCLGTLPYRYSETLEKEGIKAAVFEPFKPFLDVRLNNRDHRKILVIDGHTAFSGGINIADEYINVKQRFGHWKDNAIMLRGKAVFSFTMMFLSNWMAIKNLTGVIDRQAYSVERFIDEIGGMPKGEGYIQPYGDLPYDSEAVGESVYIQMLNKANEYCYIVTPYLVITKEMQNAITRAAHRGVKVCLLTPHIPDKNGVFHLSRSFYGPLIDSGVKVYEYTPGFVHEKVFIVDDKMATVGTINLDYRSLYLHLECGTFIALNSVIADMKADFEESISKSQLITAERWRRWHQRNFAYWGILRIAAPFL
ncbi:MAG: cardiolipin synthase [Bacillota bacterium]|nr:cardiolipin synthase [Bacillota bacterium]